MRTHIYLFGHIYTGGPGPGYSGGPGPQSAPNCGKTDECDVLTVTNDGKDGTGCEQGSSSCFVMHSDMLHEAPLCMGIAYDNGASTSNSLLVTPEDVPISTWNRTRVRGNTVWYVDGLRGRLMRFMSLRPHTLVA
jgi:hypothetical protein